MNEITYQKSYQEYKEELKTELNRTVESFVRIGYLLKVARDTDILSQSEYDNVVDFAKAEYGIDKTQVSRFIHINDKFSEGGYADHLLPEYQGYGYAKLTIMLQLPDAINEELSPKYSKTEIQTIKDELDEESKISDIEVMLEQPAAGESIIEKIIMQLAEDEPDLYIAMNGIFERREGIEAVKEQMVPSGIKTYTVRVKGTGRMMLMLSEDADVKIVNSRSGEKTEVSWKELMDAWENLMQADADPKQTWEKMFCRQFPEEAQVAPVQQQKKESKVTKAKKQEPKKPQKPINTERKQVKEATAAAGEETETKRDEKTQEKPINTLCEAEKEEKEEAQVAAGETVPENAEIDPKTDAEEKCQNCSYYGKAADAPESVPNDCMYIPAEDNNFCDKKPCEMDEEASQAVVNEEPEKVTGEVVENVDFTECDSPKGKRIWMIKNAIMEDIEKLRDQTQSEQWAGATLTVTDIELQLRQVKALLTEEDENGSVSDT